MLIYDSRSYFKPFISHIYGNISRQTDSGHELLVRTKNLLETNQLPHWKPMR